MRVQLKIGDPIQTGYCLPSKCHYSCSWLHANYLLWTIHAWAHGGSTWDYRDVHSSCCVYEQGKQLLYNCLQACMHACTWTQHLLFSIDLLPVFKPLCCACNHTYQQLHVGKEIAASLLQLTVSKEVVLDGSGMHSLGRVMDEAEMCLHGIDCSFYKSFMQNVPSNFYCRNQLLSPDTNGLNQHTVSLLLL